MKTFVRFLCLAAGLPLAAQVVIDQRLGFEENRGQYRQEVRYVRRPSLYVTSNAFVLAPDQVSLQFQGADPAAQWQPAQVLPGPLNFYPGNDPSRWMTGLPRYGALQLPAIYPGIDASFRDDRPLRCRLTLAPGADASNIRVQVSGVTGLSTFPPGYLTLSITRNHGLQLGAPSAYQSSDAVQAQYSVLDSSHFGFQLGEYDRTRPLTIEFTLPDLLQPFFSARGTVAPSNLVYLAGSVPRIATDPAAIASCDVTAIGCRDAVLVKYSPTGQILYLNYLSGGKEQVAKLVQASASAGSILSPPDESVFVAGSTNSTDFPTTSGALQRTFAGASLPGQFGTSDLGDLFVARFDGNTGNLIYSTLLGGPQVDGLLDMHASPTGDASVYLTGFGTGLPVTAGAYLASGDTFVAKIDPQGSRLTYLSYLPVLPDAVDIGRDGGYYFAGASKPGFPTTPGAYQRQTAASQSVVLAKLNPTGTALAYATYYTDTNSFVANSLAIDSAGNAWFQGESNFAGVIRCCFTAKIDAAGSRVLYAGPFVDQGPSRSDIALYRDELIGYSVTSPISGAPPGGFRCGGAYLSKLDQSGSGAFVRATPWTGSLIGIDSAGNLALLHSAPNGPDIEIVKVDIANDSQPAAMCVLNSASFQRPRAVAPGEMVTIFGLGLGPSNGAVFQLDTQFRVPTSLAGTRVLFNGQPAPILYTQNNQVNTIVPFNAQPGATLTIEVEVQGQRLPALTAAVSEIQPDIFSADSSGSGHALAFNQDGTLNDDLHPASPGSIATLFLTGLGVTVPPGVEGAVATSTEARPAAPISLTAGGLPVEIVYAGPSPGSLTSVVQINFRVPDLSPPMLVRYPLFIGSDEWVLRSPLVISVR